MSTLSNDDQTALLGDVALDGDYVVTQERRVNPRFRPALTAHVSGLRTGEAVQAEVGDISEGGLFVRFPDDVGACVGVRCELVLSSDPGSSECPACVDEPIYATVVRTFHVEDEGGSCIGAGLRFDMPIFL